MFGLTTPTNAAAAWAIDLGFMGRKGEADDGAMVRTMLSYGVTEDVQVSWSMPLVFSAAPWLVTLSRHKTWIFGLSGTLMGVNAYYACRLAPRLRARAGVCGPEGPDACGPADRVSRAVLWVYALIDVVGVFTAFILGPILVQWG